jgi:toxin ParE1/3/4
MSREIVLRRIARTELDHACAWYEDRREGLGVRFRVRVERTLDQIAAYPLHYAEVEEGIREARVPRFPYCIYFAVDNDRIVVYSVFHTSRDTNSWKSRI